MVAGDMKFRMPRMESESIFLSVLGNPDAVTRRLSSKALRPTSTVMNSHNADDFVATLGLHSTMASSFEQSRTFS